MRRRDATVLAVRRARVGLVADRLARQHETGVATYARALTAALARSGRDVDVELLALPEGGAVDAARYGGVPISRLPWPRFPTRLAWTAVRWPRVNAGRNPLDLLHDLVPITPVPTDLPLVVTIHDLMPIQTPELFSAKARVTFRRSMRHARRHADHIVTVSERTRRDVVELLGIPPERVTAIHLGAPPADPVDAQDASRRLAALGLEGVPYVMFLGEVRSRKNPVGLLEAFALVATEFPAVRLVFVGRPGLGYEALVARVAALGLAGRVDLLGHLPRPDVVALLSNATVFAMCSHSEGFGLPVVEAMSYGAPVLVTDTGSLPEVAGDAALVVPHGDPPMLAAGLARMLGDTEIRRRFAAAGRLRAAAFTWDETARRTVEVYAHVLERRRVGRAHGAP